MALELWRVSGKLCRDRLDRFFVGPLTHPTQGGAEYYRPLNGGMASPSKVVRIMDEEEEVEEESFKDASEAVAKCEQCGTPLNGAQVKRGGKFCSQSCANKANAKS